MLVREDALVKTDPLFSGKTVFVAGGTSGINLEIARSFAHRGARVAVASRDPARVDAAAAELRAISPAAMGLPCDVRDYDAVAEALAKIRERFGEIDIVISGAAGNFVASADTMSSNAFRTVVDIDLIGTFNLYRAAYLHLRCPGASLIAISAPQGSRAYAGQAHVCAAKAGINMLTKCLALEWGPQGIRVNAISPGPVEGTEGMARLASTGEMAKRLTGAIPLRRFGQATEIAEAVLFLAGPGAQYVTGAVLDCDGGFTADDGSAFSVPSVEH